MVKQLRLKRGYRQDDLAEAAGLSKDLIVGIETGRDKVGQSAAKKIGEILGVDPEWFTRIENGDFGPEGRPAFLDEFDGEGRVVVNPENLNIPGMPGILAKARVDLMLSHPDVSQRTGIDATELSEFERGQLDRIKLVNAVKLLNALDLNINEAGQIGEKYAKYQEVTDEAVQERHRTMCYRFRRERKRRGVKLTDLADRMEMNKGNLSKIERSTTSRIRLFHPTMQRLTTEIGLPEEWFDEEYRRMIAEVDNGSWVCATCMKVWSRYRIKCTCKGADNGV